LLCTTSRLVRRDWQSEKTVVARTSRRPDQSCSATYSFFQCRNVYEENLGFSNVATPCPFWHCLRLVDLESYADVWRYGTAIHPRFGPDAWRNCRGADRCPERERLVIRVVSPMRRLPAQPYRRVGRDQGPRTKEASDHCSLESPNACWPSACAVRPACSARRRGGGARRRGSLTSPSAAAERGSTVESVRRLLAGVRRGRRWV
jgi:hypothetical protein